MTYVNPNGLSACVTKTVLQLRRGELEHVFSSTQERSPRSVIYARLGPVEALECSLLASQRLDVRRVAVVDRLEEASVEERPVRQQSPTKDDSKDEAQQKRKHSL